MVSLASGGRQSTKRRADLGVAEDGAEHAREPGVRHLCREEVEEAVELVGVAPERRRELGGIRSLNGLDVAHLNLQPPAEPLHAPEHAHGVAFREPPVEQVDVTPDARLHGAARVDELQGEVRRPVAGRKSPLPRDAEHAVHRVLGLELGDRHHGAESTVLERHGSKSERSGRAADAFRGSRPRSWHYARAMAEVAPFRAVRYASPSGTLVSPPYDVVTPEERDELLARSPHNVAQLTLAEREEEAGRRFREWLEEGVLVREPEPSFWVLEQEYVGPDGVARTRLGLVVSLRAEPYDAGSVLPHERTHAGPKESRLRLLRAARHSSSRFSCCTKARPRSFVRLVTRTSRSTAPDSGGSATPAESRSSSQDGSC